MASRPHFLTELHTVDLGGRQVRLTQPLRFRSEVVGYTLEVPVGFVTDYASVPRGLWNLFPPFGTWNRAAVVHDAAYAHQLRLPIGEILPVSRLTADRLFLEAMKADGVGWQRGPMFLAVRLFGWIPYRRR